MNCSNLPHAWLPGLLLLGLSLMGCTSSDSNDPAPAPAGARFGDNYEISVNETPAAPDTPPALSRDSLLVTVSYTGGCETHDFELDHEVRSDTARLWLRHDASGDDCSEQVRDEIRMPVPLPADSVPTIVLLNPQGGEPFMLRWDGEE